uniref:basic proline-rich protein-like n=1 Tax=Agelaius phoeniceus TaxID=39638 RepID=UPI0023EC2E8B|nr:basic proline-rich protein-like [Agelaius phoeniceus]
MPPRARSAAVGRGRAPTGGVPWLVSTRRSSAPRGWRDRPPPSGHSLSRPPGPAPPALSRGSSRPPPPVPPPPSPAVWPCRKPRRGARARVGRAPSPRVSREGAWAGPAGSRDRHRARARLKGAVPGGTAPRRTLPDGTVPSAVRARALPVGWAEGGDQPRVPAPSGRGAGKGILLLGPAARDAVPAPCHRLLHGPGQSRPSGAAGAKGSEAIPVGRCRRWPRVPGPAPLPGAARRGREGTGPRVAGGVRPGTTGARSQGSRSVSALGKRQHGNKMAGKGWDCHGEPCGGARPPPPRPPGLGAPVPAEGSGAGVPGAVPPPGPAARLSSGGEAAAENGCSAEPAESCHGGGDGEEAAQPSPPPAPGSPGQAARGTVGGSAGRRDRSRAHGARCVASDAARRGSGAARPERARPVPPCTCPQPPPGARRSSGGSEPRGARRKGGRSPPAARHAGGAPAPQPLSPRPVLLSV